MPRVITNERHYRDMLLQFYRAALGSARVDLQILEDEGYQAAAIRIRKRVNTLEAQWTTLFPGEPLPTKMKGQP